MAEKENVHVPPSKKRKLSLSLKNRFKAATNDELEDVSKVKMTKNTIQSRRWAIIFKIGFLDTTMEIQTIDVQMRFDYRLVPSTPLVSGCAFM